MEWLFNYHFCLKNLILHWVTFQLLLFFVRKEKMFVCIPVLPYFSFSFLRQYWLLEMNQLKSWVYLHIGNLEFQVIFAIFVHVAGFFEYSSHLHILVSVFCHFLHYSLHTATAFLLAYSRLCFWYVYIFSLIFCLVITFSVFPVLLCKQVFSSPFHRHYFSTYKLLFSNNLTQFLNSLDKILGSL